MSYTTYTEPTDIVQIRLSQFFFGETGASWETIVQTYTQLTRELGSGMPWTRAAASDTLANLDPELEEILRQHAGLNQNHKEVCSTSDPMTATTTSIPQPAISEEAALTYLSNYFFGVSGANWKVIIETYRAAEFESTDAEYPWTKSAASDVVANIDPEMEMYLKARIANAM